MSADLVPDDLGELRACGLLTMDDTAIDGSHVRARKGGDHVGPSPVDRARPGSQHHVIVDQHGTPLTVSVTRGNRHDVTQLIPSLEAIPRIRGLRGRPRDRPKRLYADRSYDSDKYRRLLWARGIKPVIAGRGVAHGSGLGCTRWEVDRAFRLAPSVQTAADPRRAPCRSPPRAAGAGLRNHLPSPTPEGILKRSVTGPQCA